MEINSTSEITRSSQDTSRARRGNPIHVSITREACRDDLAMVNLEHGKMMAPLHKHRSMANSFDGIAFTPL